MFFLHLCAGGAGGLENGWPSGPSAGLRFNPKAPPMTPPGGEKVREGAFGGAERSELSYLIQCLPWSRLDGRTRRFTSEPWPAGRVVRTTRQQV